LINRRKHVKIIDFSSDDFNDNEKISYCKHCLEYNLKVPLKNRIYPNEPIPVDHDQWKQCHECGSIYAVYELEKESSIKDVVETSENPFDIGTSFLGIDSRKLSKKRIKDKELDYIDDDDVKRELRKGHTLLSYSEEMPQQS
jgi:hypothetical protein